MKIFSAILKMLVLFSMLIWTAYGTPIARGLDCSKADLPAECLPTSG
uniref:Putative potassium channel toxin Tx8 n=1 Tax=Buthus israelis TaxID=2899555 RepID=B8XH41_BUTIS|nr:putative potassium channel toxin Tx8 [Buthus occitanus israelis]